MTLSKGHFRAGIPRFLIKNGLTVGGEDVVRKKGKKTKVQYVRDNGAKEGEQINEAQRAWAGIEGGNLSS